jgi:hypothetical protein
LTTPNLPNLSSIYGNTLVSNPTTVTGNLLVNTVGTNSVVRINSMMLANFGGSTINANINLIRSGVNYYIAGNIGVPSYSTIVVVGKNVGFYLVEGDYLQANVSANTVSITGSYEIIS